MSKEKGTRNQIGNMEEWAKQEGLCDGKNEEAEFRPKNALCQPDTRHRAYYDSARKEYLIKNARGVWISLSESGFKRRLRSWGYSTKPGDGELMSDADRKIVEIQDQFDVTYAGPLAGYRSGFYDEFGVRFLVTESPNIVEAKAGEYPILGKFLENLFQDPECDQLPWVLGWLKTAYETLLAQGCRPGQVLVIAGAHDCGKSLFQKLVTEILGGRYAKPHQFMMGETQFNSDLFVAEHLMLEDEQASTDLRARRNFGARIKDITVNDMQRCHAKNRVPVSLRPFWRLTLTVNDEPENLMILPPIDDSIGDKMIIVRAGKKPMPMPTGTLEERKVFWEKLRSELPAFLHALLEWEIPANLRSERFGIKHFHHPAILGEVDALAPERRLLSLIDGEIFGSDMRREPWSGSAEELEAHLRRDASNCRREAERLFSFNNACAIYLGRLQKKVPGRISQQRTSQRRTWTLKAPAAATSESPAIH